MKRAPLEASGELLDKGEEASAFDVRVDDRGGGGGGGDLLLLSPSDIFSRKIFTGAAALLPSLSRRYIDNC